MKARFVLYSVRGLGGELVARNRAAVAVVEGSFRVGGEILVLGS
jgi:hypothetical protein